MSYILQLKNLTHIYSKGTPFEHKALDRINLNIEKGEFISLIGHTGSGKSTLIQHLNGLLQPTSGSVLFDGQDIFADKKRLRSIRFKVGLLFQYPEYQLFGETVAEDVAFGPVNMGLNNYEISKRVDSALRLVGLSPDIGRLSPFELSGRQKRRVAMAGVLAMQPEVLVLDEPTAGLDPRAHDEILELVRRLHKKYGTTIILVTHSMEDAANMSERICIMKDSKIFADGSAHEIFGNPDILTQSGLTLPVVTQVLYRLRERGINIDTSCCTVQQAAEALVSYRREISSCSKI